MTYNRTKTILKIIMSCQTSEQIASCNKWLQNHLYKLLTEDEYQFLQDNIDFLARQIRPL